MTWNNLRHILRTCFSLSFILFDLRGNKSDNLCITILVDSYQILNHPPTRKWMNPIFLTFSLVCMYLVNPFLNSGVPVYNTYVGSGELVSEVRLFVIFMELCLRSHAS